MPAKFHNFLDNSSDQFSVLHLNIRSIKKNFENFKLFLNSINFTFSVICLSETWWDDLATIEKSLLELPNYNSTHQARGDCKGAGVSIYVHISLDFTVKSNLRINNKDIESVTIEILSEKKFLNNIFSKIKNSNKSFHIAGDFNLNLLDHELCKKRPLQ